MADLTLNAYTKWKRQGKGLISLGVYNKTIEVGCTRMTVRMAALWSS